MQIEMFITYIYTSYSVATAVPAEATAQHNLCYEWVAWDRREGEKTEAVEEKMKTRKAWITENDFNSDLSENALNTSFRADEARA